MSNTSKLLRRKRRTTTVSFCVDPNEAPEVQRLRGEVEVAKLRADKAQATDEDRDRLTAAEAALDTKLGEVDLVVFHLQALGAKANEKLTAKHPPTDDQRREAIEAQKRMGVEKPRPPAWNTDTYLPALIAAACTSIETPTDTIPGDDVTVDLLDEMMADESWSPGDMEVLGAAALEVQTASGAINRDLVGRLGEG